MRVVPTYLGVDGCWILNYCVQGSWAAQRHRHVLSDPSFALPDQVTFNCDPEACCCTGDHASDAIAPAVTGAPWFDGHLAASGQFFGFLAEDMTLAPVAAVDGGGWEAVMTLRAIGSTMRGLQRGLTWLESITRGCSSLTWYEHCRPAVTNDEIPDDGWRTACGARRIGELQSSMDESFPGVCVARIVATFRGDSCIVGTPRQGPERILALGEPTARELCIPGPSMRPKLPSWLVRPPQYSALPRGRWVDPWSVFSPPASFVSPTVASHESVAWEVIVRSPNEPLFNLRLEVIELEPDVEAISPTLSSFRQYRRRWTALLPELPSGVELSIGAPCGGARALIDGIPVPAMNWLRGGSAGPYAYAPVMERDGRAGRFALVAWASAEQTPEGCRITPCDATVQARVRNVYRPAA